MRVIGGEYKSRLIKFPRGFSVRPTKDRVREAIFNIVAKRITGSSVADFYAGSGALGIEALSRGAGDVVFVDEDTRCVKTIAENITALKIPQDKVVILKMRVEQAIKKMARSNRKFDIIFMDPPYQKRIAKQCLIIISKYGILKPKSFVVVEHHRKDELGEEQIRFIPKARKHYGDTDVTIFESP